MRGLIVLDLSGLYTVLRATMSCYNPHTRIKLSAQMHIMNYLLFLVAKYDFM